MKLKSMKNPKFLLTGIAAALLTALSASAQTTLAKWTFESLTLSTANTNNPPNGWCTNISADIGSGSLSSFHSRTATAVYSTPAGNGSSKSLSANNYTNSPADFFQFTASTLGYGTITVSYDQVGSGTGPGNFNLQYSTDGVNFTTFTNYTLPSTITSWSASAANSGSSFSFDLSSVTALNDQPLVYFRVADASTTSVNGGTVGTGGTGRMDNVAVLGTIPGPAVIAVDPPSTNVNFGDTVTLSATVNGTAPIYYQWYYFTNGSTATNALVDGPNGFGPGTISGSTNSSLTLSLVDTNQAGNYFLVATNAFLPPATSHVAILTINVRAPIVTNIAYLHTLHDANYALTDTTNLYQVEGIVTTSGDLVSSGGQSAYFQDASGSGMDLFFFTGTASYSLPNIGDHIRVTGQLSQFDGALEIQLTANPAHKLEVLDSGNPLPTPKFFDFSKGIDPNAMEGYITNGTAAVPAIEGSYVIISNVFLGITNSGGLVQPDQTIFCTNLTGQKFFLRVPNNAVAQTALTPLPGSFAKSVRGVMAQFQTSGAVLTNLYAMFYDLNANIEVGTPPVILVSPIITSINITPDGVVLSGTNNNGTTSGSYAVLSSTNISLPVSSWTAVSTQAFKDDGSLSVTNPIGTSSQQFYILQPLP
jgi:hypothetical protein